MEDRMIVKFTILINTFGKFTNACLNEMDLRRKRGTQEITISHAAWNKFPIKLRNNFKGFFHIFLITKYKKHVKAIDVRAFDVIGEDRLGIRFRFKCDTGSGWFNNGVI